MADFDRFFYMFIKDAFLTDPKVASTKFMNMGAEKQKMYLLSCIFNKQFLSFSDNCVMIQHYFKTNYKNTDEIPDDILRFAFFMIIPDMIIFAKKFVETEDFLNNKYGIRIFENIMKKAIKGKLEL